MLFFGKKDYFSPREDGTEPVIAFVGKYGTVKVFEVPAVVGRESGKADVLIDDATVSRKHFYIATYGEKLTATDQGSTSGTVINGETLEPGIPYYLSEGDKVKITIDGQTESFTLKGNELSSDNTEEMNYVFVKK